MRILITTQVVDRHDPILGFFHRWIEAFAKECESVEVICLRAGEYSFPDNVRVTSLGKERGGSRLKYITRFYRAILTRRHDYDAVFVHMNPEYVVLGGVLWRLWGKKIGLWYTHGSVSLSLRLAVPFSHRVFTASRESFPFRSGKVRVVGHGIVPPKVRKEDYSLHAPVSLVTVGRISRVKRIETLCDAITEAERYGTKLRLTVIGDAVDRDGTTYRAELLDALRHTDITVDFIGPIDHDELPLRMVEYDAFVSASATGGLDKAVLEALALGIPSFTTNNGARTVLVECFPEGLARDGHDLAQKLHTFAGSDRIARERAGSIAREYVFREHSLGSLISHIYAVYDE